MNPLRVITIGYAKQTLQEGSREHARMLAYAEHVASLDVIVFTLKKDGFTQSLHAGNLTVHPTHTYTRFGALIKAFLIGRSIRSKDSGSYIVSAQDPLWTGIVAWALSLYKNTNPHIQVHGDYFSEGWSGRSPKGYLMQMFARVLLRRAPAIRTASHRITQSLVKLGIKEERITTLPIRPELENFRTHATEVRTTPPLTFLYVGRLAPEKNIIRMLYAFALFIQKHPEAKLHIVGSGTEEDVLKDLVHELHIVDSVTFTPWTAQVPEVMSKADIFLFTSLHEAYGLVLIEAMAVGLPVITTNVGCVGEVVKNEEHGIVIYKESIEALEEAMERMYTDHTFRNACRERCLETVQSIANVTPEQYREAWVNAFHTDLK